MSREQELMDRLSRLGLSAMAEVLYPVAASPASANELSAALRVAGRHRWLLDRWLAALGSAGMLHNDGDHYWFPDRPAPPEVSELAELYQGLGFPPEMAGLHRSILERLLELLRDEVTVQDVLFSSVDVVTALAAYQRNVFTDHLNVACAELIRSRATARTTPPRIVEIGGGAGLTTATVLSTLDGIEVEYLFTDVSQLFTAAAEKRYGVRTAWLDLNRPFAEQGFAPRSADIVLAGNALHNAVDIGRSLYRIRELLAPGGLLVFAEAIRDDPAVLTGMQFLLSPLSGTQVPRQGRFFLDSGDWRAQLKAAGFASASVLAGDDEPWAYGGLRMFSAEVPDVPEVPAGPSGLEALLGARPGRVAAFLPGIEHEAVVYRNEPETPVSKALAALEREQITTAVLPPRLARALPTAPTTPLTDLSALTRVICSRRFTETEHAAWSKLGVQLVTPPPPDAVEQARRAAEAEIAEIGIGRALSAIDAVDRAALLSMLNALHSSGCFHQPGQRHTRSDIVSAARPSHQHEPLLHRWLAALVAEGTLRDEDGELTVTVPQDQYATVTTAWDHAGKLWQEAFGSCVTTDYARACAESLPQLLTGEQDPIALLFPQGRSDVAGAAYRESIAARYQHAAVAGFVAALGEPLRLLEVGAGTGATTDVLLSALTGHEVDYLFTDVSRYFVEQARQRFGERVGYGVYDLDLPPREQGHELAAFDVIVAGGALNAVADTDVTLGHLRGLLKPGGWLVLTEPTTEEHWVLISQAFLLTSPRDERAQTGATFLTLPQWRAAIDRAGLHRGLDLPPPEHPLTPLGHRVFAARRPD